MSKINSEEYHNNVSGFSVSSDNLSGGNVIHNENLSEMDNTLGVTSKNVNINSNMFISSSGNSSSGELDMKPDKLLNISLNGVDLASRINTSFQHINEVFEGLIESVQTPELNSKLKSLYETFRKVENDFDRNNQIANKFFESQVQSYSELAEIIIDEANNLSQKY